MPRTAAQNALYQARKEAGLCVVCGAGLQEDDGVHCVECREQIERWRQSPSGREANARMRNRDYHRRRALGMCADCSAPARPGRVRCERHAPRRSP